MSNNLEEQKKNYQEIWRSAIAGAVNHFIGVYDDRAKEKLAENTGLDLEIIKKICKAEHDVSLKEIYLIWFDQYLFQSF